MKYYVSAKMLYGGSISELRPHSSYEKSVEFCEKKNGERIDERCPVFFTTEYDYEEVLEL